jgi:putative oxidoreductase
MREGRPEEEAMSSSVVDANALTRFAPTALAVLRVVTALLLIEHGTQKLFGFPPGDMPSPAVLSLLGVAGGLEFVGGLLVLVGLFTRPAAFVLSGLMAAAYFIGHAPQGLFPVSNGGDAAILYCFIFLYLVFAGPGAWSIDRYRSPGNGGRD